MAAEYIFLVDTGAINVDTSTLLNDVIEEWRAAISQDLNVSSDTIQGTLISAEAIARTSVMKNNAELANTINPNLSYGTFLDSVCAFLGIERGEDLSTTGTNVQILGDSTTRIQTGSRVQTINGDVFTISSPVVIGQNGTSSATIKSEEYGPVSLPIGTLTIIDGTVGWGSAIVTAQTAVSLGVKSLTDPQLKNARVRQLAVQGTGSTLAIAARLLSVPNVTSVNVVENNTGAAGLVQGVTFNLPNALWVCVAGSPVQQDVADALYAAHQSGCPWDFGAAGNGVPVASPAGVTSVDPVTGLRYASKWTTPILFDTYVNVIVGKGTSATSPQEAVANAIMNYSKGLIAGEQGFVVGGSISGFELAGAISLTLPGLYIKDITVACVPAGSTPPLPGAFSKEFVMSPFGQAQIAIGNIKVTLV